MVVLVVVVVVVVVDSRMSSSHHRLVLRIDMLYDGANYEKIAEAREKT